MADQSQYLAQAIQAMQASPAIPQPAMPDLVAMQKQGQARAAWEAANPGQSYLGHNMQQMGQNIAGAPGNVMSGFQRLAQGLPGMAPRPGPDPVLAALPPGA